MGRVVLFLFDAVLFMITAIIAIQHGDLMWSLFFGGVGIIFATVAIFAYESRDED